MHSTRVADVLAEVFRTYGFDTTTDAHPDGISGTTHTVDVAADKDGMDVLVAVHQSPPGPLEQDDIDVHRNVVHDVGAFYGLIVSTQGFTEAALLHGRRHKMILWDLPVLERVIGKAVLCEVFGVDGKTVQVGDVLSHQVDAAPHIPEDDHVPAPEMAPDPLPYEYHDGAPLGVAEPGSAAPPESSTNGYEEGRGYVLQTSPRRTTPIEVAQPCSFDTLGAQRVREENEARQAGPSSPGSSQAPDQAHPQQTGRQPNLAVLSAMGNHRPAMRERSGGDPRVFQPAEGALLAPLVSKESAARMVREKTFTIDHTSLRYHPKRVFHWQVEAFVEGQVDTKTLSGIRIVDLATRDVTAPGEWNPSRSLKNGTFDVAVDHKPVRLEQDKAEALALDSVLDETARDITVEDVDVAHDIMVTMKKKVRAHRDDVQMADDGLHWCPVWCFRGVNGEIEVDALTGQVLTSQLRSSSDNTIVL